MEITRFISLITKKILIVLLSGIVMSAICWTYISTTAQSVFESAATIMVEVRNDEINSITYDDIITAQYLSKTYGEILRSNKILGMVISDLNLSASESELLNNVSIKVVEDTQIIKIRVRSEGSTLAANIANQFARSLINYTTRVMNLDNVRIIDSAQPPTEPVWPNYSFTAIIGFFAGCICGVGIILFLELKTPAGKIPLQPSPGNKSEGMAP